MALKWSAGGCIGGEGGRNVKEDKYKSYTNMQPQATSII